MRTQVRKCPPLVTLLITRSWVQNLSLPDERSNRETSRRIGFYSVYLVSLQGLPFTLLYFIYIDLHRLLFIHILYVILGWGSATPTSLKPIQILQNKALRIMNKCTWSDRVNNELLYQKYDVLKINDLYKLEFGKFMYFYHAKAQPEIFQTFFFAYIDPWSVNYTVNQYL